MADSAHWDRGRPARVPRTACEADAGEGARGPSISVA